MEQGAQTGRVPFSAPASLWDSEAVVGLICGEVRRAVAAQPHAVPAVKLIDIASDGDPRLFTPALTLKRESVLERFAPAIEVMYRSAPV